MMDMLREIYPVGQGAFYTEYFDNDYTVAYDCGSYSDGHSMCVQPPSNLKKLIDSAVQRHSINLQFISHFHLDHINGIKYLLSKNKNQIKLVLPRVSTDLQTLYLVSMALEETEDLSSYNSIYADMKQFWGDDYNEADVVYVDEDNDEGQSSIRDVRAIQHSIRSGDRLYVDERWMYIPIVYISKEVKDLARKFKSALDGIGVNFNNGFIEVSDKKQWREIVRKYKDIVGYKSNLENNVSLIVYSGPVHKAEIVSARCIERIIPVCRKSLFCRNYWNICKEQGDYHSGALYVGDMEDEKAWDEIHSTLSVKGDDVNVSVLDTIGMIQISHHGSMNEFNKVLSENLRSCCAFCCFGSVNKYKHPSYLMLRHYLRCGHEVTALDEQGQSIKEHIIIFKP